MKNQFKLQISILALLVICLPFTALAQINQIIESHDEYETLEPPTGWGGSNISVPVPATCPNSMFADMIFSENFTTECGMQNRGYGYECTFTFKQSTFGSDNDNNPPTSIYIVISSQTGQPAWTMDQCKAWCSEVAGICGIPKKLRRPFRL